ncbi:MAG: DUF3987 domain-containing protein, partial [Lacipirellulaceae bacterium]
EYKGGKGSDLGHWLAVWSAGALTVDRKSGPIRMMHVPRAAVSLVGGVQPGVLRTAIGREHMQDGLCARLLLAMPRPRPVVWTDETVSPEVEQRMAEVFDRLCELEPAGAASLDDEYEGEVPEPEPFPLDLTPEAKAVWWNTSIATVRSWPTSTTIWPLPGASSKRTRPGSLSSFNFAHGPPVMRLPGMRSTSFPSRRPSS